MSYGPSMQRSSLLGQAAATIVGQAAACLAQKKQKLLRVSVWPAFWFGQRGDGEQAKQNPHQTNQPQPRPSNPNQSGEPGHGDPARRRRRRPRLQEEEQGDDHWRAASTRSSVWTLAYIDGHSSGLARARVGPGPN